jgi:dTDP-4-amino-4,6-dideoxygalactose transaminase
LQARIGLGQMRKADWVCARRVQNQRRYEERFANAPQFHVPHNPDGVTCSISFVALAPTSEARDRIAEVLRQENIETRPLGGGSMGRQPFWANRYGVRNYDVADAIHTRSFMLPNNPDISLEDVDHICYVVLGVAIEQQVAA